MTAKFGIRNADTGLPEFVRTTVVEPASPETDEVNFLHHVAETAPPESRKQGIGTASGTGSTAVTGMEPESGETLYVTDVQVANSGSHATLIALQDGSG